MPDWLRSTVLVTGATAGFGEAIARRFHAAGARVIGAGRRQDRLDALGASLGDRFLPLVLDVRDRAAVVAAIGGLPDDWSAIDLLVNNAGLAAGLDKAWEANPDDWDAMIATNCAGLAWVTRAVLPGMVARRRGHVVNLGSIAGSWPYPGGNVYGATKAFVAQFSHNLRADLHGTGVRVTSVEPGLCGGTEFSLVRFHGDGARADSVYAQTDPLTADDVTDCVFFAANAPQRVNIDRIEVMPTVQSFGPLLVHRQS